MTFRTALMLVVILVFVGCFKQKSTDASASRNEAPDIRSMGKSVQNRVIQNSWSIVEDDSDISDWPSGVFALANKNINRKIRTLFKDGDNLSLQVFFVPETGGYSVFVVGGRTLNEREREEIRVATSATLDESKQEWVQRMEQRNKSGK